jgi:hypothetical protein
MIKYKAPDLNRHFSCAHLFIPLASVLDLEAFHPT